MCYIGPNVPLEAKEDIEVFKVCYLIDGEILSPIVKCKYNVNSTYYGKLVGIAAYDNLIEISEGFHSYLEKELEIGKATGASYIYSVKKQSPQIRHIYRSLDDAKIIKLHCIIPKGSTYYVNKSGICVSDALKTLNYELVM